MLPYLFAALTMTAVGKAAYEIVLEVRRQFAEMPGIMERTTKPDYKTCVAISTQSAAARDDYSGRRWRWWCRCSSAFLLGAQALAGMLIGANRFRLHAGGDDGQLRRRLGQTPRSGSRPASWAAKARRRTKPRVVGDTVGDPFKDTSGPSLNILIKLMSIVSLVFAQRVRRGVAQSVLMRNPPLRIAAFRQCHSAFAAAIAAAAWLHIKHSIAQRLLRYGNASDNIWRRQLAP